MIVLLPGDLVRTTKFAILYASESEVNRFNSRADRFSVDNDVICVVLYHKIRSSIATVLLSDGKVGVITLSNLLIIWSTKTCYISHKSSAQ